MKTNIAVLWILTVFFVVVSTAYTAWNIIAHPGRPLVNQIEWVGTIALLLSGILSALIAFYLMLQVRRQGGELPEDSLVADIDDGDPEVGEFSPWSWWPLVLAGAAGVFLIGLAIGTWLSWIGGAILVVALVGWTYEYYRGYFAR
ncbi:MAG: cytochrome c oxidase subunit 4 [Microbacteriaceae bacterium]|nr:cytochrome c oxidase subunit 4 [Microbacteriaceae bacterium]HOA86824.1 cytochrome c oxidase subunit 4 [Microbacteriaceae bacterium]HPZ34144.1 cytochrome c oxidase subunit 4 [Microbacteriaceae bacterium]HQE47394.1 cytochrome c oxidase subunit 4 [Rhodoglobus sp.]